jgi:hypothetical protein
VKARAGGTLPLFEVPAPPERPAPKQVAAGGPATWSSYRPKKRAQCEDCVAYLHEHKGRGPAVAAARFRRTAAGVTRLLCGQHAQRWRDADQMPRFRGIPA